MGTYQRPEVRGQDRFEGNASGPSSDVRGDWIYVVMPVPNCINGLWLDRLDPTPLVKSSDIEVSVRLALQRYSRFGGLRWRDRLAASFLA